MPTLRMEWKWWAVPTLRMEWKWWAVPTLQMHGDNLPHFHGDVNHGGDPSSNLPHSPLSFLPPQKH